jgi:hypothetical protein
MDRLISHYQYHLGLAIIVGLWLLYIFGHLLIDSLAFLNRRLKNSLPSLHRHVTTSTLLDSSDVLICSIISSLNALWLTNYFRSTDGIFERAGTLATFNLPLLCALWPRENVILEYAGLSSAIHTRLRLFFAILMGLEAALHAGGKLASNMDGISIAALVCVVLLPNALAFAIWTRIRYFEVLLAFHDALLASLLVLLWLHVGNRELQLHLMAAMGTLVLVTLILPVFCVLRHNGTTVTLTAKLDATEVTVQLPRAIAVLPGQYIYLTLGNSTLATWLSPYQFHPFWITGTHDPTVITVLVERKGGFSSSLYRRALTPGSHAGLRPLLHGPYGRHRHLEDYEIVIFWGQGSGIGQQISYLAHLTQRYGSIKTRKILVYWILSPHQKEWFAEAITCRLLNDPEDARPQVSRIPLAHVWTPADGQALL